MAYTAPQIGVILLKADRTMYKIGQIAYENMFAEDNEALDYERDVIFIYKKAVEFADDFFVGTEKLDKVVERLATKISAYDYGELNPIYADAATVNIPSVVAGAALNDLTDVTIANLLDNQFLRYNAATGQWINVGPGSAVRSSQAFIATAGQTVFTTSAPFDAGLFDLYVNGVKLNSLSYTTMGEYQITLNDPCSAGDIVDVVIYDPNTGINPTANTLNDLTDVNIGPLANKQGLYYNSASGLWENGLVFVPYTGATAAVDLGEFEIRAGQFTLDTSPTGTATVGTTRWNDSIGSSETTLKGGSVILKNGVDLVARVVNKVTPNTTLTKASYAAVRISGAQGQRLAVAYAQANNDANSADTIGLVTETIATNQEGFIMTMGNLEGINTTGSLQGETWADGDVLYLSPTVPGGITNVKPTGLTGHIVVVGYVEYAHANNGKIYVKTMNGWELDELHNVNINTGTLANGDVLKYNSTTQLWENGVDAAGISGSGAAGQVNFWTGASAVSGSNNLFWDNTNSRLGVNRSTPLVAFDIASSFNGAITPLAGVPDTATSIFLGNTGTNAGLAIGQNNAQQSWFQARSRLAGQSPYTILLQPLGGNVYIGTTSDLGVRLGVVGDTLLRGSGNTSATTALTVQNSSSTDILNVRNDGAIFIGSVAIAQRPYLAGYTNLTEFGAAQRTLGIVTQFIAGNRPDPAVLIKNSANLDYISGTGNFLSLILNYSPTSGTGVLNNYVIQPTINQTGGANGITRGLYVNPTLTSAADWRSIEWSNNSGWGLYGAGTAANYLAGRLLIGSAASINYINLYVSRNITGGSFSYGIVQEGIVQSDVITSASGFTNAMRFAASVTNQNYYHFDAQQGSIGAGSTVTNQYGFHVQSSLTGATNNYGFYGNIASGTGRWNLYMNGTANNYLAGSLGIGSTSLTGFNLRVDKSLTGAATNVFSVYQNSTVQSDVTGTANGIGSFTGISGTTALGTLRHFVAAQGTFAAGGTLTTQIGFAAASTLTSATNNYGFYGGIASGTGRWNLYMEGTADNYLAGNLGIGITPTVRLHVSGDTILRGSGATNATTALTVQNSDSTNLFRFRNDGTLRFGSEAVLLSSTGNGSTVGLTGRGLLLQTSIGTASSVGEFTITGSINPTSLNTWTFKSSTNFIPTTGTASYNGIELAATINQQGGANGITRGLYVNPTLTAAADWRSIEWSNNTGWGLYGAGTANNYLAGNTQIGAGGLTGDALLVVRSTASIAEGSFGITLKQTSTGTPTQLSFATLATYSTIESFQASASFTSRPLALQTKGGDVIIGTNASLGVRFGVVGDTILRGSGATSATTALTVQNSSSTNLFTVRNDGLVGVVNTTDYTGRTLFLQGGFASTVNIIASNNSYSGTSGAFNVFHFQGSFVPTSGSAVFRGLNIAPTINQTGGASGVSVGIRVAPTLTAAADFRAIETTDGKIVFGNLPTSSAGLPTGALWNDAGTVKIV